MTTSKSSLQPFNGPASRKRDVIGKRVIRHKASQKILQLVFYNPANNFILWRNIAIASGFKTALKPYPPIPVKQSPLAANDNPRPVAAVKNNKNTVAQRGCHD